MKKIDISGGPAQTVCDLTSNAIGGDWTPEGVIIFGTRDGIMRVSASGGTAVPVTARDRSRGETLHVAPMLLPDHRHFLYLRRSASQENSGIYVGSLDAKPEQQSTKQILATDLGAIFVPGATTRDSGHLLFLREGTLLAQTFDIQKLELTGEPTPVAEHVGTYSSLGQFSAASNSVLIYRVGGSAEERLTWYDRQGNVVGTVGDPGQYLEFALSPDGRKVAVSEIRSGNRNI